MLNSDPLCPLLRWRWLFTHLLPPILTTAIPLFTCLSKTGHPGLLTSSPNGCSQAFDQVLQKLSYNTSFNFFTLASHQIENPVQDDCCDHLYSRALHGQALIRVCWLFLTPDSRQMTSAFDFVAPRLWNSLPSDLRSVDTVDTFTKQLICLDFCLVLVSYFIFILMFFRLMSAFLCCSVFYLLFLSVVVNHFVLALERCYRCSYLKAY